MSTMPCFFDPVVEQYNQSMSDVYSRYIDFDSLLGRYDKRVYGVSSFKTILELTCMCTPDKHRHHPIDSHDNCKCDCVGDNFNITAMASFRRKLDDIMAVCSGIHSKWTIHRQKINTRLD
jgi:hypothetical protein